MSGIGLLEGKFAKIGARLGLGLMSGSRLPLALDVRRDREGEYFTITGGLGLGDDQGSRVEVLDVQPADRHLLLMVRQGRAKHKFLCGHDERHWFVAAVPEAAPVGTVRAAKEALKPAEVVAARARAGLSEAAGNRRKNAAYRRQGEWFFIPEPRFRVDPAHVLRDEPIRRSNQGKPHLLEFCHRSGGEVVYTCGQHPNGLGEAAYRQLIKTRPEARRWGWRFQRRNPEVHARGRVRHADHATITLHGWHRIVMNTETRAVAMRHVAFLD